MGHWQGLRRVRWRSSAVVAAVAVTAVAASGCAPEPSPTPSPTPKYVSNYEPPAPTALAPLRGTSVAVGSLDHASIAAKIDNHPDARPQIGLESTDLLFEELVEGGLTRYVGVWQSTIPQLLGPVRSIRPMDPAIISPLGGIVCYSGGQQRFVNLMRNTPVYNAIHGQADTASTFYRTPAKSAPHNVLVKAQAVLAQHKKIVSPAQQFAFALDVASSTGAKDGKPTAAVNYRFSNISAGSWTWNAAAQVFLRAQAGHPDKDSSGAQLKASNVIIVRVSVIDDQNVPKTLLSGSGEAWVSSGGGTVHARWSKSSDTAPIRLVDDQGVTIRLAPGNSWIELVPLSGAVQFTAAAAS